MKLSTAIRETLERSGLPWSLENGGRHIKIRVGGRLVGVYPKGKTPDNRRGEANVLAQIRRACRAGEQP